MTKPKCTDSMPVIFRAFVLCWEAANTNASGCTERHGPETEHMQLAASTRAGLWALAYNREQGQAGQPIAEGNLGKGNGPL